VKGEGSSGLFIISDLGQKQDDHTILPKTFLYDRFPEVFFNEFFSIWY